MINYNTKNKSLKPFEYVVPRGTKLLNGETRKTDVRRTGLAA